MPDTLTAVRETFDVLAADTETRTVTGLAVPYGEDLHRPNWMTDTVYQRFAEGAAVVRENAQLFYGHDHLDNRLPIGRIITAKQTPKGLVITARISETPKGDEVYTLLKDGVITQFSIGFYFVANHVENAETDNAVLIHDEVDVFEVSVVPDPAFKTAVITDVLHRKEHPMPDTLTREDLTGLMSREDGNAMRADLDTLSSGLDRIEAQVATLGTASADSGAPVAVPGDSYGEFLQMAARGDTAALDFLEYVGGTVGDLGDWVKDTWIGDIIREVNANRTAVNFFGSSPLPATGMGVEWGKLAEDTTQVGEQENEGDELPFGKIKFDTDRSPLVTVGGWGEMSRQKIERSSMSVVERFFRYLIRRYSKFTELAVRGPLASATGALVVPGSTTTTADGWIDFLIDAAVHYDEKGLTPEAVFLGAGKFKSLAKLRDGDNGDAIRLLTRDSGSVNIKGLKGEVHSIPFRLMGSLPSNAVRVAHPDAIHSWEASGAPWRLQDEDITNLTKAFSIYGYQAVAAQEPDLIVVPADDTSVEPEPEEED